MRCCRSSLVMASPLNNFVFLGFMMFLGIQLQFVSPPGLDGLKAGPDIADPPNLHWRPNRPLASLFGRGRL